MIASVALARWSPEEPCPFPLVPQSARESLWPAVAEWDTLASQRTRVTGRRDYADFRYEWDFGDPASGDWPTSSLPRNRDFGYVAGHVYEAPGTYTVTLQVTTTAGATVEYTEQIDVADPEAVYAGVRTACVSTGTDFAGCPPGAQHVTTTDVASFAAFVGSQRRVLLRRGDAWLWPVGAPLVLTTEGPFTLGAFGPCVNPDRLGICANAPVLDASGPGTSADEAIVLYHARDIRILDLAFLCTGDRAAIGGVTEMHQVLFLRLRSRGFNTPVGNSHWETEDFDQLALVSSDLAEAGSNVVYIGGTRLGLLGNVLRDAGESHVVRLWQAYRAVVGHNEVSGSSVSGTSGRHALKLHGPSEDVIASTEGNQLDNRTQHVIVHDNVFGSSGPWPAAIGPQDSGRDERLSDIIFERNRLYPSYGTQSASPVQAALHVWARNVTVRNNVFSGVGSANGYRAVVVEPRGVEPPPVNVRIYNNTVYLPEPGSNQTGLGVIQIGAPSTDVLLRNNLFEVGGDLADYLFIYGTGSYAQDHNLMTNNAHFAHATGPEPLSWDFSLLPGSPGLDAGTAVPVTNDLLTWPRPRGNGFDLGALEAQPSGPEISISDVSVQEGDPGTSTAAVIVTVSE